MIHETHKAEVRIASYMKNWNAEKIVKSIWSAAPEKGRNPITDTLNRVFDAISADNWKAPFVVSSCVKIPSEWVKAAITWKHGAAPVETMLGFRTNGYQG